MSLASSQDSLATPRCNVERNVHKPRTYRKNHHIYKTPEFVDINDDESDDESVIGGRPMLTNLTSMPLVKSNKTYSRGRPPKKPVPLILSRTSSTLSQKSSSHETSSIDLPQNPTAVIVFRRIRSTKTNPTILRRNVVTHFTETRKSMAPKTKSPTKTKSVSLENLPNDLNRNFTNWFYGDSKEFRRKTKTDLRPVVEKYIGDATNSVLNPDRLGFVTQDLNVKSREPSDISQIVRYKMTLKGKAEDNLIAGNVYIQSRKEKSYPQSDSTSSDSNNISIIIEPEIVIIDRRPMLKKQTSSTTNANSSSSLIEPEEDCDDSSEEIEFLEIDCDS